MEMVSLEFEDEHLTINVSCETTLHGCCIYSLLTSLKEATEGVRVARESV